MRSGLLALAGQAARRLPERARLALYRLGPISHGLRSVLNRAAPVGVQPVQVAAGDLRGMWLLLDLQVDKDLWLGAYEPDVAAAIRELVRPGSVVYDVGANVGYTTLLLARAVGPRGKVIAFEPLETNVSRLMRAIALNRLEANVEVVAAAVAERGGRASFERHASGSMGRLAPGAGPGEAAEAPLIVEVVALDGLADTRGLPPPALVKIDVEGSEAAVLRGMSRLLREARPILLIEIHGRDEAEATYAELERAGYRAWSMRPVLAPKPATKDDAVRTKHVVGRPGEATP